MKHAANSESIHIHVPANKNVLLQQVLERVNENEELRTLWRITNIHAIERLNITDHGSVHFQIVANIGLRLTRLLMKHKIDMSVVQHFDLTRQHAELIVLMGALLHDLGMVADRENHEYHSLFLAHDMMKQLLDFLPIKERTIVISETLHAVISHRSGGKPLTVEAGIVRVADALDMSNGRSRIPYEQGKMSIYFVSATAIDKVEIVEGEKKPIRVNVSMTNSAGVFQIDELLKKKLRNSGIEQYFEIKAFIEKDKEKELVKEMYFDSII